MNENLISQNNSVTTEKQRTEINRITVSASWKEIRTNSAMPNAQRAPFYARLFAELLEKYAGQDEITLYTAQGAPRKTTIAELRSCKQIYTDDHTETFWKERNYIQRAEKLFLAPSGLLVEIKRKMNSNDFGLYYTQTHPSPKNRMRFCVKDIHGKKRHITPEKLEILVFNGAHSQNVRKLLDKKGPQIIFSDEIQVHHIYGYKYGATLEEAQKYMSYNCDLTNIQLLTREEHLLITKAGSKNPSTKFMNEAISSFPNGALIQTYGNRHGYIADNLSIPRVLKNLSGEKIGKLEVKLFEAVENCKFYVCKKDGTAYKRNELPPDIEKIAEEIVKKMSDRDMAERMMFEEIGIDVPFILVSMNGIDLYGIYCQENSND